MKRSFTLIEILVVIVIVGVLSAFILVGMSSITSSANIAKGQAFANSLDNALLLNRVSYWKLDEVNMGTTSDVWGINTGTVTGATLTSSGCVKNNCFSFDGSDDIVNFGNNASLWMGTNDHTVSLWVKFDNAVAPQEETLFVCILGGSGAGKAGYWLYRYYTDRLYFRFSDGLISYINNYMTPTGAVGGNTWYYVVVTMDRDGVAQAYINGQIQTGYSLNISAQTGNLQNSDVLRMGAYSISQYRLAGKIDEPKIYHAITSVSLINEIYYSGINELLVGNEINKDEFNQRIVELKTSLVSE
jgi:prepilin-type N-terminal cleavage/methylation domain-containing protein